MYESFFGFTRHPFAATPQPYFYFPAPTIESAKKTVSRCIQRCEGPVLVIGQAGMGKTLLCQLLQEQFCQEFSVCHLANSRLCSRRTLLQAILYELGLEYREMEEGELRLQLIDFICSNSKAKEGLLLLVDEAHSIPNPLLEEMRMITNLVRDGKSRVRLVLTGLPYLEERFASPKLESFSQRIAARCYLDTLTWTETAEYIRFQITRAGANLESVMDENAMRAVYAATDGVPRLINQLCDHSLVMAAANSCKPATSTMIQEAWTDLQQLPAPDFETDSLPVKKTDNSFIEFGSLDEAELNVPALPTTNAEPTPGQSVSDSNPTLSSCIDAKEETEKPNHLELTESPNKPKVTIKQDPIHNESEFLVSDEVLTHNPFAEPFEEEEVIIDRFVSLRMQADDRPQVTCAEGQEIANLLPETHRSMSLFNGTTEEPEEIVGDALRWDDVTKRVMQTLEQAKNIAVDSTTSLTEPIDVVPYPSFNSPTDTDQTIIAPSKTTTGNNDPGNPKDNATATLPEMTTDQLSNKIQPPSANIVQIGPFAPSTETTTHKTELKNLGQQEFQTTSFAPPEDKDIVDIVHPITDDVIVVENNIGGEQNLPTNRPTTRVERMEYDKLFAKLCRR